VARRSLQGLAQRYDFLVQRAVARWLAIFSDSFLMSVKSIFLDLSRGNLGDAQASEKRN
jgi:hypothetical protein